MAADKDKDKEKACAGYHHGPPWVFKGRQARPQPAAFLFSCLIVGARPIELMCEMVSHSLATLA